jgi:lipopolysaccharide export system protein LptA
MARNLHAIPMSSSDPTCFLVRPAACRPSAWAAFAGVLAAAVGLAATAPAHAERADRTKPMVVEADRPGTVDLQRQVVVFNGNVVISQGTMVLRADRVEMREMPDGFRAASAIGGSGRQASWRQRRDGPADEIVEGVADRIEFDGKADTLRFVGNGAVRRLRGGAVADEITGATIVWDNLAEVFRVEGGAPTAANPSGRVRVILSPRAEASGADAAAGAASAGAQGAPAAPLAPARSLGGERR